MIYKMSRKILCAGFGALIICVAGSGMAFAGPLDNASEFTEEVVERAEARNTNPSAPATNSGLIEWADDSSPQGGTSSDTGGTAAPAPADSAL